MSEDAKTLIELAVSRFLEEVPALEPMKLVVAVELRGRGDVQHFRLEMPGIKVTKAPPDDARVRGEMRRFTEAGSISSVSSSTSAKTGLAPS